MEIVIYRRQRVDYGEQSDTTCLVPKFAFGVAGPSEFFIQRFSIERSRTASPVAVLQRARQTCTLGDKVGPANDGYFEIIRNGLNCHWKRYGEFGRLIKTYYLLDKFRAKVIIKIWKILAESSTSHWKVRRGHCASRASTVWRNVILQLVRHPRRLGVTGRVQLNICGDLLNKCAVSFENRDIKEIHNNLYCFLMIYMIMMTMLL